MATHEFAKQKLVNQAVFASEPKTTVENSSFKII